MNPSMLIQQRAHRTPRTLSWSEAAHPLPARSLRLRSSPRPPLPERKCASGHPPRETSKRTVLSPLLGGGGERLLVDLGHRLDKKVPHPRGTDTCGPQLPPQLAQIELKFPWVLFYFGVQNLRDVVTFAGRGYVFCASSRSK